MTKLNESKITNAESCRGSLVDNQTQLSFSSLEEALQMNSHFKKRYGKPKTLTDRYDECSAEAITRLLRKPEAELGWNDFNMLFLVGVAPASYEEGVYFLPEAFAFLRRNPSADGINCVADVIWFISEYAERLRQDGLLEECREEVRALLAEQTREFVILHWDRATSPEMCGKRDHRDHVGNDLPWHTLEALLRFRTLGAWAEEFLDTLLTARGEPLKSAWFLELVGHASSWLFFKGTAGPPSAERVFVEQQIQAMPGLVGVWEELQRRGTVQEYPAQLTPEPALLEHHASVIRSSGELFTKHPTYWAGLFGKLGLEEPPGSAQGPAAGTAVAKDEIALNARRDQLIRDIEEAFRSVERGAGLTLHEAAEFEGNDYCTAEERVRVRALDPETRWQDIPDSALEECVDRWAFDEEGLRYHLPAYMRWHVRHPEGLLPHWGGMLFWQLRLMDHKEKERARWERCWGKYTLEQKRVIARFLEFMALEARQHGPDASATEQDTQIAELAERAWRSYWFKFSQ